MAKKILIAEDTQEYKDQYKAWAENLGFEVIEASSVCECLEKITQVDAVITDHGLKKGNGNDLAKIAKEHNLPVAGISQGGAGVFDANYVDIPESKDAVDKERFGIVLECLFQKNPREAYSKMPRKEKSNELSIATNILLQGYYVGTAILQGYEEIKCKGRVVVSKSDMTMMKDLGVPKNDPKSVFELFSDGTINPNEVYRVACENNPRLANDTRLKSTFEKLSQGNHDLTVEEAVYAAEKLGEGIN